jgi:hypothetical protein
VPLPAGVDVPAATPPLVQVVGAVVSGPKTVKVMVLTSLVPEEPVRFAVMLAAAIDVPAVPVAGAVTLSVGEAMATAVLVMVDPHVLTAALLFASSGDDTYHQ